MGGRGRPLPPRPGGSRRIGSFTNFRRLGLVGARGLKDLDGPALFPSRPGRGGVTQLAFVSGVTHVMAMSNEEILAPNARSRSDSSGRTSRATFGGQQARGPIIDQDGREIPEFDPRLGGFRFDDFRHSAANPFGDVTRAQRLGPLRGVAKRCDLPLTLR